MTYKATNVYTANDLRALPTLSVGHTDDLKIDNGQGTRVWLSRVGIADGAPYDNGITVQRQYTRGGPWTTLAEYAG